MKKYLTIVAAFSIIAAATTAQGKVDDERERFWRDTGNYQGTCSCRWVQQQCGPVRRPPTGKELYPEPGKLLDAWDCNWFQIDYAPIRRDGIMFRVQCTFIARWERIPRTDPTQWRELFPSKYFTVPLHPLPDPNEPPPDPNEPWGMNPVNLNNKGACLVSL